MQQNLKNPLIDLWDSALYPEDPLCLREGYKDGDRAEEEEEKGDRSRENNFKIDEFDANFRENNADSQLSRLPSPLSPSFSLSNGHWPMANVQIPRPWLISGKLDPKFVEWLAQKWSAKYGDILHTARSNVLRHFKKDEQNIIIAWSEYSAEYLDRYRNTQTRIATGLEIAESEQKRLIDNVGALTRPLPEELSPVAEQKTAPELIFTQAQPKPRQEIKNEILTGEDNDRFVGNKPSIDWHKLPTDEEKPENFEAYRQWQPEKIDKPATLRQIQEFLKSFGKK